MFDIWRKIEEKGACAVPVKASALSALGWVEIGEKYPELIPEEFRHYDVYSDPQLILKTPFVRSKEEGEAGDAYDFLVKEDALGKELSGAIDFRALIESLGRIDYDGCVLTCGCSVPECAGFWEEYVHVSSRMVHWSIKKDKEVHELFFERETFEENAIAMLRDMYDNGFGWDNLACPAHQNLMAFRDHVDWLLEQRPYFRDMWNEMGAQEAKA